MLDAELVQGSPEWYLARNGSVGSSEVPDVVRRVKSGAVSASRASLMAIKVVQRLTPDAPYLGGFRSREMQTGTDREPIARKTYAFLNDVVVEPAGLVRHPLIKGAHASPDGLVGARGLAEFKCPQPAAHLETLLTGEIERDYQIQIQWQLACTGRDWCDYVSFNPDFPAAMQLWVKRVERDAPMMTGLEAAVIQFLDELEAKLMKVKALYEIAEAA